MTVQAHSLLTARDFSCHQSLLVHHLQLKNTTYRCIKKKKTGMLFGSSAHFYHQCVFNYSGFSKSVSSVTEIHSSVSVAAEVKLGFRGVKGAPVIGPL